MSSTLNHALTTDAHLLAQARQHESGCPRCAFELWLPLGTLSVSSVGLYDDARFPGRLIVSLTEHFDHLDDLPPEVLTSFMLDVRTASRALTSAVEATRVNMAVLGNAASHVHAHLIPRIRQGEPLPDHAPWQDPRPRQTLSHDLRDSLMKTLSSLLG